MPTETPYTDILKKIAGVMSKMTGKGPVTSAVNISKPEVLKVKATSSILKGRASLANPLNKTVSVTSSLNAVSNGPKPPKIPNMPKLF